MNEQPYEYWRNKFAARGYAIFDCARRPVAGLKEIEPWYRFNTFVYANDNGQSRLSESARRTVVEASAPLAIVAPWQWRLRCYLRTLPLAPFVLRLATAARRRLRCGADVRRMLYLRLIIGGLVTPSRSRSLTRPP